MKTHQDLIVKWMGPIFLNNLSEGQQTNLFKAMELYHAQFQEERDKEMEEKMKRVALDFSFWCRDYHNCGDSGWGCLCKSHQPGFITIEQGWNLFRSQQKQQP